MAGSALHLVARTLCKHALVAALRPMITFHVKRSRCPQGARVRRCGQRAGGVVVACFTISVPFA